MTKLQRLRKAKGMSSVDLCYAIRVHPVAMSAIENRRQLASPKVRSKICGYFGVDIAEMFDDTGLAAM